MGREPAPLGDTAELRKELRLAEEASGSESAVVAAALTNLAGSLVDSRNYEEAEPLYRRALSIWETVYASDANVVAIGEQNLASVLARLERWDEAERLYRHALSDFESQAGPNSPQVVALLGGWTDRLEDSSRWAESEPLLRRILAIREVEVGPFHPDVAGALNNLARVLMSMGRHTEAEPLLRRALVVDEIVLGVDHPRTKMVTENLRILGYFVPRVSAPWDLILGNLDSNADALQAVLGGPVMAWGNGPFAEEEFRDHLRNAGATVVNQLDSSIVSLVLGREDWNPEGLRRIFEVLGDDPVWVYSQEMLLASLIMGYGIHETLDEEELLEFGKGHPALEYLLQDMGVRWTSPTGS